MRRLPRVPALAPLAFLLVAAAAPAQGRNPLARQAADPWARTFAGGDVQLALRVDGEGYAGTLTVAGAAFPARAARAGDALRGSFEADGEQFAFTCTLEGEVLVLESDGERHRLRATAPSAPAAGPRDTGPAAARAKGPAELQGVHEGPAATLRHPEGWFHCEVPRGWSIAECNDELMLVNPGLQPTDTLECLLFATYGELDEADRGADVVELFGKREGELLGGLAEQGIEVAPAGKPARKVAVGDRAGAEQQWRGRTMSGGVTVWCGALIEREYYLAVVAIAMDGKEGAYLPGAKRMFRSLVPKAPEPNPRLEAALAGATFAHSETLGDSGSLHGRYTFGTDGTVRHQTLMSGSTPTVDLSGEAVDTGRYRAVGRLVYLQFRDGQRVARVEGPDDGPTALRFGAKVYRRR